jgi:hypothetical protein
MFPIQDSVSSRSVPVVTEGREQFHARPSEHPDAFTVVFYGVKIFG